MHLGSQAFVQTISPSSRLKKKAVAAATKHAESDSEEEFSSESADEGDEPADTLTDATSDEEVDDPVDFEAGDVLGKALAFISQV